MSKNKKYSNICIVNTKGGAGKSTLAFHLFPYFLTRANKSFNIVEIDNNNNTSAVYTESPILHERIKSVVVESGKEEMQELLEKILLEKFNASESDKKDIYIIDAGGGDDTKAVIDTIFQNDLAESTLFVIPYMPSYAQIDNVETTIKLLNGADYIVVANSISPYDGEDDEFVTGNEKWKIPNMQELYNGRFFIVPKTTLYDRVAAREKRSIADAAMPSVRYRTQNDLIKSVSDSTASLDENSKMKMIRKDVANWTKSREYAAAVLDEHIEAFYDFIAASV